MFHQYDDETTWAMHERSAERDEERRSLAELEDQLDVARVINIDEERRFFALDTQLSANLKALEGFKFLTLYEKKEVA